MAVIDINDLFRSKDEYNEFPVAELNGSVEIRPLTEGENSEIQGIKVRGMTAEVVPGTGKSKDVKVDISQGTKNDYDANVRAIILACRFKNGDKYVHLNPDQVSKIRPVGVVKKIAQEIFRISGDTSEAETFIDSFRKNEEGSDAVQPS